MRMEIAPNPITITAGETLKISAPVTDDEGFSVTPDHYTWAIHSSAGQAVFEGSDLETVDASPFTVKALLTDSKMTTLLYVTALDSNGNVIAHEMVVVHVIAHLAS